MKLLSLSTCLVMLLALSLAVVSTLKYGSTAVAAPLTTSGQCEGNGYQDYIRLDGTRFKNSGACRSYAARDQTMYLIPTLVVANPVLPSCQYSYGFPDTVYLSQCSTVDSVAGATCEVTHDPPSDTFPVGRDTLQNCGFTVSGTGLQSDSAVVADLSLCQFTQCPYNNQELLGMTNSDGSFSITVPFNICFKDSGTYITSGTVTAVTDIGTTITADLPITLATGMILGPSSASSLLLCQ